MIENEIKQIKSRRESNRLQNDRQVETKLKFYLLLTQRINFTRYHHTLKAIEAIELLQLWLGMRFGFNIISILLG